MAYLRARRSIKVAPGVKLNLNKRSFGVTVGSRGAHYSVNSRGRRTTTVGIPGTGLSWVDTHQASKQVRAQVPPPTRVPHDAEPRKHPRLLASKYERLFAKALGSLREGRPAEAFELLDEAILVHSGHESVSAHAVYGVAKYLEGDYAAAIPHLEEVVATHVEDDTHQLLDAYDVPGEYEFFDAPVGQHSAPGGLFGLEPFYTLVSAYVLAGQEEHAIGVLQKLIADPSSTLPMLPLVLLCELYHRAGDWDEIIHLATTFQIANEDDQTLMIREYVAVAMANKGLTDAALEVIKDCLRSKKRDPELLLAARYLRSTIYLNTGKRAAARRELSRIYAEDPSYRDTEELLHGLNTV